MLTDLGYFNDDMSFNEDIEWKLDVGKECNLLLELSQRHKLSPAAEDIALSEAIESIVERLADFEDLDTEHEYNVRQVVSDQLSKNLTELNKQTKTEPLKMQF